MKNILKKWKFDYVDYLLVLLVALFVLYLFCDNARSYLSERGIDAGFLTGFIASFTLLFAIKQSIKDKKFAYNMSITTRIEDVGAHVIGKLLRLYNDSEIFERTVLGIKQCMDDDKVYHDVNDTLSKMSLGEDSDKIAAYIDMYFPTEAENWNEVLRIMSEMGSIASSVHSNYYHNDFGKIPNEYLSGIEQHIKDISRLKEELGDKPQDIMNNIVALINENKSGVRKQMGI